ncbi:MAG: ATP-binding protein [Endozoicomonadaceae bacterium]|nr:ATP-binding protein [Endozoicomonadaceae bacterium]
MEKVRPNVTNFIESLRDIGYSFEVAVADILDNSISAKATKVEILSTPKPDKLFCLLDNGTGMIEKELVEAMRFASRSSQDIRDSNDLGKFGLGLKTASFSQCRALTVITKKSGNIAIRKWDIDVLKQENDWILITPEITDLPEVSLVNDFIKSKKNGTLVVWEKIDTMDDKSWAENVKKLDEHLSLVFHQFLERKNRPLRIFINNRKLEAFNPFNVSNKATQPQNTEVIPVKGGKVEVTPHILPHPSKTSPKEWNRYSTTEGYTRSQGFYLYRAKRLLVYGTWWGMHKITDTHQLVRIKIDIPNDQDEYWGIDIKKSRSNPREPIRSRLRQIMHHSLSIGSRPYKGRGKSITNKGVIGFWETIPDGKYFRFGLNRKHPLYNDIKNKLGSNGYILDTYLSGLESYLPINAIQHHLLNNPHSIKQESALPKKDIDDFMKKIKDSGQSRDYLTELSKTELLNT